MREIHEKKKIREKEGRWTKLKGEEGGEVINERKKRKLPHFKA